MTWKIALPMYNVSTEIRARYEAVLDAVIDVLRAAGWQGAVELERSPQLPEFWKRPDMLFSQTCGYPYMTQLQNHVNLIVTPCYGFPGCRGGDYSSVIVVRKNGGISALDDARGHIAAANDINSNSGMNVLRHAVAPLARNGRFFAKVKWSGSHAASLAMVRDGEADIAAIDCVTFAYLQEENPTSLAELSILQYSASTPGLPMIASNTLPEDLVLQLRCALLKPNQHMSELMRSLSIREFTHCIDHDYARVGQLESEAQAQGFPFLN